MNSNRQYTVTDKKVIGILESRAALTRQQIIGRLMNCKSSDVNNSITVLFLSGVINAYKCNLETYYHL